MSARIVFTNVFVLCLGLLSMTLVDHNVHKISDQSLEDCVIEIIDHHKKDRKLSSDHK